MPTDDIPPLPPDIAAMIKSNQPLIGQEKVDTYPFFVQGKTVYYRLVEGQQAQPMFTSDLDDKAIASMCKLLSDCWKKGWELCSQIIGFTISNPSASIAHYLQILAQIAAAKAVEAQDSQGDKDEDGIENKPN